MGDVLDGVEKGLTTFLQELYKNRTASATYRRRAAEAQNQADLIAAAAQQKNTYLLQSNRRVMYIRITAKRKPAAKIILRLPGYAATPQRCNIFLKTAVFRRC